MLVAGRNYELKGTRGQQAPPAAELTFTSGAGWRQRGFPACEPGSSRKSPNPKPHCQRPALRTVRIGSEQRNDQASQDWVVGESCEVIASCSVM
jgi:hypothetical protein